jgi:hypothetical protein
MKQILINLIEEYARARALAVEAELTHSPTFNELYKDQDTKKQELFDFIERVYTYIS